MGGDWSPLLMSGCRFVSALMLLLFSTYTVIVCKITGPTIEFTASPAIESDKVMTVVMVKETWFGAFQYCRDNKLGHLLYGGSRGNMFIYMRHQLFLDGWKNTDFLWTGFVKPASSETIYRAAACKAMPGIQAYNASSTEQQCLAVNMTTDNMDIDWLATSCENKHNFVCMKQKGDYQGVLPNNNLTNYVITNIDPNDHFTVSSTSNSSLTDCMEKCTTLMNRFASVYDVTTSVCKHYAMHVYYMPVHVVVEETNANKVVCVKNVSFAIKYFFPDGGHNVTEAAGEILPCSSIETPISTSDGTIISTSDLTTISTADLTTINYPIEATIVVGTTDGTIISTTDGTTIRTLDETTISATDGTTTGAPIETTIGKTDGTTISKPERTTISTSYGTTRNPSSRSFTTIGTAKPQNCGENPPKMCVCEEQIRNLSAEELLLKVKLLKEDLAVERTSLSSYKRKRFSASDDRTSAQVIGGAGAFVIAAVIFSIIILDLKYLMKFAYRVKAKF